MTQQWEIVTRKEPVTHAFDENSNVFALCIDGIVQITINVDDVLAGLYSLNPEIVKCKPTTTPGMTIEEARE